MEEEYFFFTFESEKESEKRIFSLHFRKREMISPQHIKEISSSVYIDTRRLKIIFVDDVDNVTTLIAKLKELHRIDPTIDVPSVTNLLFSKNKKKYSFFAYEYVFRGSFFDGKVEDFPYPEVNLDVVKSMIKRYFLGIKTSFSEYVSDDGGNPISIVKFSSIRDDEINFYSPTSLVEGMNEEDRNAFFYVMKDRWNAILPILSFFRENEKYFDVLSQIYSSISFTPNEIENFVLPQNDMVAIEEGGIYEACSISKPFSESVPLAVYYFLFEDEKIAEFEIKKLFLSLVSVKEFEEKYEYLSSLLCIEREGLKEKIDLFEKIFSVFIRDDDFPSFNKEGWCLYFDSLSSKKKNLKMSNYLFLSRSTKLFVERIEAFMKKENEMQTTVFQKIKVIHPLPRKDELLLFFEKLRFEDRIPLSPKFLRGIVYYNPTSFEEDGEISLSPPPEKKKKNIFEGEYCCFPESLYFEEEGEEKEMFSYIKEKIMKRSYCF